MPSKDEKTVETHEKHAHTMPAAGEHESAVRPSAHPVPQRAAVKLRKFEAPAELPEKFNVSTHSEDYVSGFVKTEDVRELLDDFGLQDRVDIVFPFQHMRKSHGEIWAMRIEPPSSHTVAGAPVIAHAWVFQQTFPERVAGVQ